MKFGKFVDFLERIGETASKKAKVSIAAELLRSLGPERSQRAVYLMRGGIFPAYDQRELNVGWSTLWKIIESLSAYEEEELSGFYKETGDLGLTAEKALDKRRMAPLRTEEVELDDVYDALVRVANLTGPSSTGKRERYLLGLLGQASPVEAKYIVKIMTGEMRYGFQEGLLEEAIAECSDVPLELVRRANMLTSDLGFVARTAGESPDDLKRLDVEPFRPVRHMLAESAATIEEAIEHHSGEVSIEWKYDGARLQVHKLKGKVKIYTRRLEDVTRSFPELLPELASIPHDLIVDGEAVYWKDGKPGAFQYLIRRLRRKRDIRRMARTYQSKFFAFDILYLDGGSLVDEAYANRREILERVVPRGERVTCSERFEFSSIRHTRDLFRKGLGFGYEGLMIKDLRSAYEPGKRGKHWFKYKEALETLDLAVIIAEYGHGSRAGLLSDYTFGAWSDDRTRLVPVGKAYSGLTDDEILEMTGRLKRLAIKEIGTRVHVKPEVVMEVAFGDVQRSPRYPSGLALRFPRIKAIRDDLDLEGVDGVGKLRRIYERLRRK